MRVITFATRATIAQARALGRSLARHEPTWAFEVLLLAGDEVVAAAAAAAREDAIEVRSAASALGIDVETAVARFGERDLETTLVPRLLDVYRRRGHEPVCHLPSSAWVLGALEPIEASLSERNVLLVPRVQADVPDDGLEPTPIQLEQAGRVDETVLAVGPGAEGFLDWWIGLVERAIGALDGRERGWRPEDRPWLARFLELAPARFSTAVLDDPGCNLSMWNLQAHTLSSTVSGVSVDGNGPVRFLSLPGFDPTRPHRLNARASRARVSHSPALHELCGRYARELLEAGWRDTEHRADVGRRLANGLVYDDALRAMLGSALALGQPFEDPFSENGTRAFVNWLAGPAPRGAALGVTRYVFHRVVRERPDVLRAYPDIDGPDGRGFLAWCWAFGQRELAIPEQFMPPRPGARSLTITGASLSAPSISDTSVRTAIRANRPQVADADGLAVRVTGYLGHTLGLGAAARAYVRALGAAGVPVTTASVPLHHLELPIELAAEYGRHGFEDLVHEGRHGFEIIAVNADELPDLVERLGTDYFEGPRIGIWGWETNVIPARWHRAFELVDEIWVYSRFMAQNIGAATSVPVIALAPPVEPPSSAVPERLGVPDGFLFLFIFDYLSTIQRKNPVGLIEAFKLAFAPGDGPRLLIKTINGPLRPLAEEEVLWAAHGRPDIHVVDRSLSADEMSGLVAACDCYVSLHRAEGFGLTLAEAMAIGKPVIATGYSGNVDFMNSENSYLVDHSIGRVGPECEIYPPEGEWAEPSTEHAAALIRQVYENPADASRIGARARADIEVKLSPRATGEAMRRRLAELSG